MLSAIVGLLAMVLTGCGQDSSNADEKSINKPNVVIFYVDDLGYGDISTDGMTQ
jgi:hypothetical protein